MLVRHRQRNVPNAQGTSVLLQVFWLHRMTTELDCVAVSERKVKVTATADDQDQSDGEV